METPTVLNSSKRSSTILKNHQDNNKSQGSSLSGKMDYSSPNSPSIFKAKVPLENVAANSETYELTKLKERLLE